MRRRNFIALVLATVGALPFVRAEQFTSLFEEKHETTLLTKVVGITPQGERLEFDLAEGAVRFDPRDLIMLANGQQLTVISVETRTVAWPKTNRS